MPDDFLELRAERDDQPRMRRDLPQRRLAIEIALGIWLGGMALTLTWAVIWFFIGAAMLHKLTLNLQTP